MKDGLQYDRTRPPGEAMHWTGQAASIGLGAAQAIWRAHGLAPHRVRTSSSPGTPGLSPLLFHPRPPVDGRDLA